MGRLKTDCLVFFCVCSIGAAGISEDTEVVLRNPDMGWVITDNYPTCNAASTMVLEPDYDYPDVDYVSIMPTWSDIEVDKDSYDFTNSDAVYDYWVSKGKQITLRLSTCSRLWWNNADPPAGLGVPRYVLDSLPSTAKQVRTMNDIDYTVVDARERYYLERLEAFLRQIAAHFAPDGNRPVQLIDLRGFGVWGEWHHGFVYPSKAQRRTALTGIIDTWSEVLADFTLVIPVSRELHDGPWKYISGPVTHFDPNHTTWYDEYLNFSAYDHALAKPNITLRRDGCGGVVTSNQRKLFYDTFSELNKWGFIAEFNGDFSTYAQHLQNDGQFSPDQALDDALDLHPNYIVVMGWDKDRARRFIKTRPDLIARGLRRMGYRFVPTLISVSRSVSAGQEIAYELAWGNRAVGRAMRDYELRFAVRQMNGAWVEEYNLGPVNTSEWIADGGPYITSGTIVNSLTPGVYRLCVSLFDARTDRRIQLPLKKNFDTTYEIAVLTVN